MVEAPIAQYGAKRENDEAITTRGEDPIGPATAKLPKPQPQAVAVVVMGVSGSGKSTVGKLLADRLGWEFVDGDSLHPAPNVTKMRAGQPLDDNDRGPWLNAVAAQIEAWIAAGNPGIITCSALKRRFRDRIVGGRVGVRLIFLRGSKELIALRLARRQGHFMPASLLDSQFAALEPPTPDEHAIAINIDRPVASIVDRIVIELTSQPARMVAAT